jgi:hypothetical protein
MIDKPLVEKKLRRIEEFLRELKSVEITPLSSGISL